ncbi:DNA repair protein rad2 [Mortierella sp. NVP85]|nr:DNA repair protein rad2 [Mortierella sp. NVP85]
MGVKGLWELLHPVARPIKLETLSNKHLAIDASIWLHQFLRGMRDRDGQVVGNAHIIGFFRRICKLLYFNIKPIFIFDGGTPALKRLTIQERRKRKKQDANLLKRTAEKLLAAQLRLRALEQRKAIRKKKVEEKQDQLNNVVHDYAENPKYLGELIGNIKHDDDSLHSTDAVTNAAKQSLTTVVSGGSQAKRIKDKYVLPPMEVDFETLSKIRNNDIRFGYQEQDDVSEFLDQFKKEEGLSNIDSDAFKALPSEVQYEILQDIRLRSRVTSYERVQEMVRNSNTPMDFSMLQIQGVIRRNNVTHKLLTVNQAVSKMDQVAKPGRIASQRNRQYILVQNEDGGWALGGRKPTTGMSADKPVKLDSDGEEEKEIKGEGEDEWVSDDDDVDLEEVKIPLAATASTVTALAREDSFAQKPAVKVGDESSLIDHPEAYVDEDESIENVMAKFAEIEGDAARKKVINAHAVADTTNEDNGLHLVGEHDMIQVQEGARQHLARASLQLKDDPQWPEIISDAEELESMDTMNSMETLNSEDFDNLIEDEQTGEIISLKAYNKRYGLSEESTRRALSSDEESRLDREAFHNYWTGYTPDSFKVKQNDYEQMVQEAIYEWDDDRLDSELHSATRKLEKSNTNDTLSMEALEFWKSFLESVICRMRFQRNLSDKDDKKKRDVAGVRHLQKGSVTERKSRLSQAIVLEDDDDDDDENHDIEVEDISTEEVLLGHRFKLPEKLAISASVTEQFPLKNLESPEMAIAQTTHRQEVVASELHRPILDFNSSILKRQVPSDAPEPDAKTESFVELTPSVLNDNGIYLDVSVSDPGLRSRTLASETETDVAVVPNVDKKSEIVNDGVDRDLRDQIATDKESMGSGASKALEGEDDGDGEDDEDEENEAHEADLANEEHDFTSLFPEMANLPGAILNPREPSPPVGSPVRAQLTAEEKVALEQQEAKKMLEESRLLESEIRALQDQHRKHQRDADDLTESMVADTKVLLRLFGIPYLVAPMEAEAQCADLQLRGVVDGILTEDSDVFLFGGARVFKNMFKEEKYVECYLMSDIERDLGVGRERLVALAYLLGSDYTTGIKGVGLITAMEIIRLFPKLEDFAKWWRGEQESSNGDKGTEGKGGLIDLELDSIDEVALEKLAKQCKKIHVPSTFPDPHVADAYIRPLVDDDPTEFQWGIPDLDGLRDFLRKSLDWDKGEVDQVLLPIIRQMSNQQHTTQTTLDTFFDNTAGMGAFQSPVRKNLHKSARLRKVVDGLTGQDTSFGKVDSATKKKGEKNDEAGVVAKQASGKRKPTTRKEKRAGSVVNEDATIQENDSVEIKGVDQNDNEGGEEGFVDELEERKQRAPKKPRRTPQTKLPEAVIAAKRQLKSKGVEAKLAERNKGQAVVAMDPVTSTRKRKSPSSAAGGSDDSSEDERSDQEEDDFAPSHWDLLAERQRQLQQQQRPTEQAHSLSRKADSAGKTSSLSALVSASNAARYGSSFRNKETDGRTKPSPQSIKSAKRSRRSQGA